MQRLYRHPRLLIAAMTVLVLGLGHRAVFLQQDNSPDTFFAADREARATYERMVDIFGADEVVLIQLRNTRLDRPGDLKAVARLTLALRGTPGVKDVLSPATIYLRPSEEAREPSPAEHERVKRELGALTYYKELGVYRPAEGSLGVLALLVMRGPQARTELASTLDDIAGRAARAGHRPLVAGLAPANAAIDRETRRSLGIFLPLVVVLALGIGLLLFRSVRGVLAMFLPVAGAVLLGVGGLELAGEPLNLVTGVMPPLVLAVGYAGAIHLVSHYATLCAQLPTPLEAVHQTIRDKVVPTAFSFATTALGFGSLAVSEVHAVRVLGLSVAGSLLAAMILVTLGTPAFLLVLRPELHAPTHRHRLLEGFARGALRWRVLVLLLAAGAALAAGLGSRRLKTNIDGMALLPADAPERKAYQQLEREGLGLGNIDLWIRLPLPDDAALLAAAPRIAGLARELRQVEQVTATFAVHDVLNTIGFRVHGRVAPPPSLALLKLVDDETRLGARKQLARYWHPTQGLKLTLLTKTGDGPAMKRQRQAIRAAVARHFPKVDYAISGHFAMLIDTPDALMRTLIVSLGFTAGAVALLFLIAFRNPWLMLVGMLANLAPVLAVLGLMGWLRIPLDVATVMTGSVVFGIAVDSTFHYLYHRKKSGSIIVAARIAGQGIAATTIVITGAFAVLGLSGFTPVIRFGLLTAFACLAALVVDAFVLPALVGRRAELTAGEPAGEPAGAPAVADSSDTSGA